MVHFINSSQTVLELVAKVHHVTQEDFEDDNFYFKQDVAPHITIMMQSPNLIFCQTGELDKGVQ